MGQVRTEFGFPGRLIPRWNHHQHKNITAVVVGIHATALARRPATTHHNRRSGPQQHRMTRRLMKRVRLLRPSNAPSSIPPVKSRIGRGPFGPRRGPALCGRSRFRWPDRQPSGQISAPGRSRTCGPPLRRRMLYPLSYRGYDDCRRESPALVKLPPANRRGALRSAPTSVIGLRARAGGTRSTKGSSLASLEDGPDAFVDPRRGERAQDR